MALNRNESIIEHQIDVSLDPAYVGLLETGMVMVASAAVGPDGEQLATPCTGGGGEIVLGVLKLSENSQASVPVIEVLDFPTTPAALTLTLRELPLDILSIRAFNLTSGADVVVVAGAPGAGQIGVVLATGVCTGAAALSAQQVRFTYRFNITAQELARRGGRRSVNMGAERVFNRVTIIRGDCKLMLSNFSCDQANAKFAPSVTANCGPGGTITTAAGGTAVGTVFQAPIMKLTPGIEQAFVGVAANLGA